MSARAADTLGIDFGTSNSAVACVGADGVAQLAPLEGTQINIPSAVFFNAEERSIHFGREAVAMYLAGVDGRLMRSLKSLLGSSLLHEQTRVPEGMVNFQDVISRFIREIVERAQTHLGRQVKRAVIGRPVHFVDDAPQRDKQAQAALRAAAKSAGLEEISFELEPIAAAFDYETRLARESVVLIVDIGGGTSDFTVVRLGPERRALRDRSKDVLATTGVHIGGTDYDRKLSLERVMPLLGLRHHGPTGREVPSPIFFDLSTWHLINWLYSPKSMRQAEDLRTSYSDKQLHDRLMTVLTDKLGHRIASDVELAKILNSAADARAPIDLSRIEAGLLSPLDEKLMGDDLAGLLAQVVQCGLECVRDAGISHDKLDAIYLTGGSSALRPFQTALQAGFAGVKMVEGDLFGGVASGLAYAGQRRDS